MGAIRPGSGGGGGGASALGDLSDIGTMGEPVAQADNITEVVTALGGAAALRALLAAAPTIYSLDGDAHDYTLDSAYAPSGLTTVGGGDVSGRLGDGAEVPYFTAAFTASIAALARNINGVRLTHSAANSAANPWPYVDAAPHLTIPLSRALVDVQIDITYAVNFDAVGRCTNGTDIVELFAGLTRTAAGARPYTLGGVWLVTLNAVNGGAPSELAYGIAAAGAYTTTDAVRDVSSSGEGTSAGITVRDVRILLKGSTVEVRTGPAGDALTRRIYYAQIGDLAARDGLAVTFSLCQSQATPASYWSEFRKLTVTPL